MRNIRPIKDRVLVRQDPMQERVGEAGILFAPQGSESWPTIGTVIATGPDVKDPDLVQGARVAFERKPASAIVRDTREGDPYNEHDLVMLPEDSILGFVEDEDAQYQERFLDAIKEVMDQLKARLPNTDLDVYHRHRDLVVRAVRGTARYELVVPLV